MIKSTNGQLENKENEYKRGSKRGHFELKAIYTVHNKPSALNRLIVLHNFTIQVKKKNLLKDGYNF